MNKLLLFARPAAWALLSLGALTASAQTKVTGNVVAYFGSEKIETTNEGNISYKFTEGWMLPGGVGAGTLFNGQDMVAWLYAVGQFKTPVAGEKIGYEYPAAPAAATLQTGPGPARQGQGDRPRTLRGPGPVVATPWTWTAIKADSTDQFRHPFLRNAYLYTSYEAPADQIVLLETTGGTRTYVNGLPHEGDHYDFGYTLVPLKLRKGLNEFVYTPGRFGRVKSQLVAPAKAVQFTQRDMTLPDLITGEGDAKWAAIRVVNATEKELKGMKVKAILSTGESIECPTDVVMPLSVRKVKFQLPALAASNTAAKITATVVLSDSKGKELDRTEINLRQCPINVIHERTFISKVDGSVQYYSMTPALNNPAGGDKAMVLSVHGASVEARNQARAYKQKDWVNIACATNRRPYGFNWEEWGRIDALEVLAEARRIFKTVPEKTYLTGHSMGGHGTWHLGTTYPDKFAAIAPCASYPDISTYGSGRTDQMHRHHPTFEAFARAANAGRTLTLGRNLLQSGVYIFHGSADETVSVSQARLMREYLGTFHNDFCYYEYPGGSHWFGDHSIDWKPIFDYFQLHTIPANSQVKEIEFHTASPAISASDYWVKIEQQQVPYDFSTIRIRYDDKTHTVTLDEAKNVRLMVLDMPSLECSSPQVTFVSGEQKLTLPGAEKAYLTCTDGTWSTLGGVDPAQKNAARYGGFKQLFDNRVVFVYATRGSAAENEWYQNKARFDAETFYYRGNGSIDVIPDKEFKAAAYPDRNVVIYGNATNNLAWKQLLAACPIQVTSKGISVAGKQLTGDDLAAYYLYPRPDSPTAYVGVVGGTGLAGARATSPNNYISGITGFPDAVVYRAAILKDGLAAVEAAGFFDNHWKW